MTTLKTFQASGQRRTTWLAALGTAWGSVLLVEHRASLAGRARREGPLGVLMERVGLLPGPGHSLSGQAGLVWAEALTQTLALQVLSGDPRGHRGL